MAKTNLNDLSLSELKKLQKDLARAIETFDRRQKQTVLSVLEERAKEFGFALSDLFSSVIGKSEKRAKAAPKYANLADPSVTWSGLGRRPRWFNDAIAAGKSPESMAI